MYTNIYVELNANTDDEIFQRADQVRGEGELIFRTGETQITVCLENIDTIETLIKKLQKLRGNLK